MSDVYIVSAARSPIGKFGGSLATLSAVDVGVVVSKAALERARVVADQVEETIFGNARQAGGGPNPARQISIRSGIPTEVPAFTVNMACASGMKAIALGFEQITSGSSHCVLAGGIESMSRLPYYLEGARWGYRLGNQELVDGMYRDGFFCPMAKLLMGETAEVLATQYKITREEQDEFALRSQIRAAAAIKDHYFDDEIAPVTVETKQGSQLVSKDEHPFTGASFEKLARLTPVFSETGTVTAGNSSGITDGAAAVLLASGVFCTKNHLKPLARIIGWTAAGVDPQIMGVGPVSAVRKLEDKCGMTLADFDAVELNEAFAAQVIACDRDLHFDPAKLNRNGGAIALGHPIGCTGARIIVTLVHDLLRTRERLGLATLCVSGGMGMALAVENIASPAE